MPLGIDLHCVDVIPRRWGGAEATFSRRSGLGSAADWHILVYMVAHIGVVDIPAAVAAVRVARTVD